MSGPARETPRRSLWKSGGLAALCLAGAMVVAWSAAGQQLDAWAYDLLLRLRPPAPGAAPKPAAAMVVALDEETLRAYGGVPNLRRPLVAASRAIAGSGAKAVAVDIQLADRVDAQLDSELGQALQSKIGRASCRERV